MEEDTDERGSLDLSDGVVLILEPLDYSIMRVVEKLNADVRVFPSTMPDVGKNEFPSYLEKVEKFVDEAVVYAKENGKKLYVMSAGRAFLVAYIAAVLVEWGVEFCLLAWSPSRKEYYGEWLPRLLGRLGDDGE